MVLHEGWVLGSSHPIPQCCTFRNQFRPPESVPPIPELLQPNSGIPPTNSGIPLTNSGIHRTNSGTPPTDSGIVSETES
ncbi:unnamed protein product, partial [Rotaria sp. Silwood2]